MSEELKNAALAAADAYTEAAAAMEPSRVKFAAAQQAYSDAIAAVQAASEEFGPLQRAAEEALMARETAFRAHAASEPTEPLYRMGQDNLHIMQTAEEIAATKEEWALAAEAIKEAERTKPILIASLAFRMRFKVEERKLLRNLVSVDDAVADWYELSLSAQEINLRDSNVVAAMDYLVSKGALTSERRDEILAP